MSRATSNNRYFGAAFIVAALMTFATSAQANTICTEAAIKFFDGTLIAPEIKADTQSLPALRESRGVRKYEQEKITVEEATSRLQRLDEKDFSTVEAVREHAVEMGRDLGLTTHEIESLFEQFIESGVLAGQIHFFALNGIDRLTVDREGYPQLRVPGLTSLTKSNVRARIAAYKKMTAAERDLAFFAQSSRMVNFVRTMHTTPERVREDYGIGMTDADIIGLNQVTSRLNDPRARLLLQVWYRGLMVQAQKASLAAAPGVISAQFDISRRGVSTIQAVGLAATFGIFFLNTHGMDMHIDPGTIGLMKIVGPSALPFLGTTMVSYSPDLSQRVQNFYAKVISRRIAKSADRYRAQIAYTALALAKPNLLLEDLGPFALNEPYDHRLVERLSAEFEKTEALKTALLDDSVVNEDFSDTVAPAAKQALDTAGALRKRLDQINESFNGLEKQINNARTLDSAETIKFREIFENYRTHLRGVKSDLNRTFHILQTQVDILQKIENSAAPEIAPSIARLRETMLARGQPIAKKAAAQLLEIERRLFDLKTNLVGINLLPESGP